MTAAADSLHELTLGLEPHSSPCRDVEAFTADTLTQDEADELAIICGECPVLQLCGAYAATAYPTAGFWAGHRAGWYRAQQNRHLAVARRARIAHEDTATDKRKAHA